MSTAVDNRPMSAEQKKVIFASSLGTVFEWYDFYLYGSLAAIIAKQFFSGLDAGSAFIFALLAFAAGFIVRPFGALVFGRLGDMIGRKYTFLVTIVIMGLSTFIVGLLPNYASIGVAAPVILIALRMLQGLALGGEYGGAAVYVAEHAPHHKRGAYTSWIQTTATLGLFSEPAGDPGRAHRDRRSGFCRLGLAHSFPRLHPAAGRVGLHPFVDE
jgi:MFS family permease